MRSQSTSLKEINNLCIELYELKNEIVMHFEHFHAKTRTIESLHLTPYFYFLIYCINLQRSASKIFKIYKQRMINKKNLIDEKSLEMTDTNLFHQSILFMIESSKQKFGTILDIYGNYRYLKVKPDSLKNKHMEYLIPIDMREAHAETCRLFTSRSLSRLIGDMKNSYLKLPERDYILPVGYLAKIVPYVQNDFKYVVGVKYNRMDSNMYMIINGDNQIDSFSYNMRYLFKEPDYYLDRNVSLEELCPKLNEKLTKTFKKRSTGKILPREKESLEFNLAKPDGNIENRLERNRQGNRRKSHLENGSLYDLGESDEEEDEGEELTRFVFKFRHTTKSTLVIKAFKVKIVEKRFEMVDFSYRVLTLIPDDDTLNDWDENISIQESSNKLGEEDQDNPSEESLISLPKLVTERVGEINTNLIRSQNETFKFLK